MARNANNAKVTQVPEAAASVSTTVVAPTVTVSAPKTDRDITKVDLSSFNGNKSAMMRHLSSLGWSTSEISKGLTAHFGREVKYQFVRNILNQAAAKQLVASNSAPTSVEPETATAESE
jgi:hypothetical protein